jgi:hypothetical protein
VAEQVQGYLDKVEEEIRGKNDADLLELAKKLVLFNEDLGQPELLELFMKQTFPPALLQGGARGKLIRFKDEAVKKAQKEALRQRFQAFMEVVPLVGMARRRAAFRVAGFVVAGTSPTTRTSTRGRRWCARVTCSASIARWS